MYLLSNETEETVAHSPNHFADRLRIFCPLYSGQGN